MSRSILSVLTLSAALVSAPACYNYVPTEIGAVPPGGDVRLRVSRAGGEELARIIESNEIQMEVSGQYEGLQQGSVLLRIPLVRDPTGARPAIQQLVRLPAAEVLTVDRRELSVGKTAALVGAGAAATTYLLYAVFDVFSDPGRPGENVEITLIPLFNALLGTR